MVHSRFVREFTQYGRKNGPEMGRREKEIVFGHFAFSRLLYRYGTKIEKKFVNFRFSREGVAGYWILSAAVTSYIGNRQG